MIRRGSHHLVGILQSSAERHLINRLDGILPGHVITPSRIQQSSSLWFFAFIKTVRHGLSVMVCHCACVETCTDKKNVRQQGGTMTEVQRAASGHRRTAQHSTNPFTSSKAQHGDGTSS